MRNAVACLLCLYLCVPLAFPADTIGPLRGYSNDSAKAERDWETKFRAIPDPANLRAFMERLSKRPHHVGSPYDKDNAEWLLSQFKQYGWEGNIQTFRVLFPTPKKRV